MSLEFIEGEIVSKLKVRVALHIIDEVVPRLLEDGEPISRRMALAYSWLRFVCKIMKCPSDLPQNPKEWSFDTLERIADVLLDYARHLLKDYVSPNPT